MYFLNVASGLNGLFPSRLNELVVKYLSIECYLLIVSIFTRMLAASSLQ